MNKYIATIGLTEEERDFIAEYYRDNEDGFINYGEYTARALYETMKDHDSLFNGCMLVRVSGNSICISRIIEK